jgi:hypothetical protein
MQKIVEVSEVSSSIAYQGFNLRYWDCMAVPAGQQHGQRGVLAGDRSVRTTPQSSTTVVPYLYPRVLTCKVDHDSFMP